MERKWWTGLGAAVVVAALAMPAGLVGEEARADVAEARRKCNDSTLKGTYGIQIQGTRPAAGQTESVVGVVIRTYDGHGGFTQIANVKGSVTGTVPDQEAAGLYEVHADCTAIGILEPAPGVLIEERMVIVDDGQLVFSSPMKPAGAMLTGIQRRVRN